MAKKAYITPDAGATWVQVASETTDLSAYAPVASPTLTGTVTAPKIALTDTTDVSLSSTGNAIQIGATSSLNLVVDGNEIQSRNNGAASSLGLNGDGGQVNMVTATGVNGNVVIGNTTGSNNLIVNGAAEVHPPANGVLEVTTPAGYGVKIQTSDTDSWPVIFTPVVANADQGNNQLYFSDALNEWIVEGDFRATSNIDANGVITTDGKSSSSATQETGVYIGDFILAARSNERALFIHRYSSTGTVAAVQFIYNGTNNGLINISSGGTPAFASGSDYRMKENIVPITDAIERMKNAKAYTFNKIESVDPEKNVITGFLAHELSEVQPDAVIGIKDAVDEEGNPVYQEVMEAKIIPVMAQAMADLIAKVESLEARLAKFEEA